MRKRFGIKKWFIPIYIPIRNISHYIASNEGNGGDNLVLKAFLREILPASGLGEKFPPQYFYYMLKKKRCLFLLDGLDEVADDKEFQSVLREIKGMVSSYAGNKFVVTSRHAGWRGGLGSSFEVFEVEDLSENQVSDFISSWYHGIEHNRSSDNKKDKFDVEKKYREKKADEKAQKLITVIQKFESIKRLTENPLLLSIICFVHYHKTLPDERLKLYEDCSALMLDQWDREKGLFVSDTNLKLAHKEEIMMEIAFSLHTGKIGSHLGRKEATAEELIPIVRQTLSRCDLNPDMAETLFEKLINRSGIILSVERYSSRYSFSHLTFQEYYTAKYFHANHLDIFEDIKQDGVGTSDSLSSWWREVVLLYSIMKKNPSEIIKVICDVSNNDFSKRTFQIAAQCLSESIEAPSAEADYKILSYLFAIRTEGHIEANSSIKPEVKKYLLRFSTSADFYNRVLLAEANQYICKKNLFDISLLLNQIIEVADSDIKLASLKALVFISKHCDITDQLDIKTLELFLSDSNENVQIYTLQLFLCFSNEHLDTSLRNKIIDSATNLFKKYHDHIIKTERFFNNIFDINKTNPLSLRKLKLLEDILRTISLMTTESERNEIRRDLNNYFDVTMSFHRLYYSIISEAHSSQNYSTSLTSVAYAQILFSNEEQKNHFKEKHLAMLKNGTYEQQGIAISILSNIFMTDCIVINEIFNKLVSPICNVRIRALNSLIKFKLSEQKTLFMHNILSQALQDLPKYKRQISVFIKLFQGKGCLGYKEEERNFVILLKGRLGLVSSYHHIIHLISDNIFILNKFYFEPLDELIKDEQIDTLNNENINAIIEMCNEINNNNELPSHTLLISLLGRLSNKFCIDSKHRATQILFDYAQNASNEVLIKMALDVIDLISPTIKSEGSEHSFLLKLLSHKQLSVADKAFDILSKNTELCFSNQS